MIGRSRITEIEIRLQRKGIQVRIPSARDRGDLVGRWPSDSFAWRVGKSLALAMVCPDLAAPDLTVLGETRWATVIPVTPFDPTNARLRG